MPQVTMKSLREGREELIKFIRIKRPQGRNEVTIIFDGKKDVHSPQEVMQDIKVIFTRDISADEKIKQIVEGSSSVKQIVVVTDDRQVCYSVRSVGAKIMSVKEFMGRTAIKDREGFLSESSLSCGEKDKITAELEKIWLKTISL